jgi:hypothetical protein
VRDHIASPSSALLAQCDAPSRPTSAHAGRCLDELSVAARGFGANQPGLPPALADWFAKDPRAPVRARAARQANLTEAVIRSLASDASVTVRRNVARRSELPIPVVRHLKRDADPHVRTLVQHGYRTQGEDAQA